MDIRRGIDVERQVGSDQIISNRRVYLAPAGLLRSVHDIREGRERSVRRVREFIIAHTLRTRQPARISGIVADRDTFDRLPVVIIGRYPHGHLPAAVLSHIRGIQILCEGLGYKIIPEIRHLRDKRAVTVISGNGYVLNVDRAGVVSNARQFLLFAFQPVINGFPYEMTAFVELCPGKSAVFAQRLCREGGSDYPGQDIESARGLVLFVFSGSFERDPGSRITAVCLYGADFVDYARVFIGSQRA